MFIRKKSDEMDKAIRVRSIAASYWFTEAILVVWIVISLIMKKSAMVPLYVLLAGLLVRGVFALIYRRSVGDDRWKKGLVILVAVIALVVFVLMLSFETTTVVTAS